MTVSHFPPVDDADPEGLLAWGGDLNVETLLVAYKSGIFPWPVSVRSPMLWFAPPKRAILKFDQLKVPKRLERSFKKFHLSVDQDFKEVITSCARAKNRKGQKGTWITPKMIDAFIEFHDAGFAQSFEARNANGKLVGGMYGVRIGNFFAGESMFHLETDASKFALVCAVRFLKEEGLAWMDIQMMTPLLKTLGAQEITRKQYMTLLLKVL